MSLPDAPLTGPTRLSADQQYHTSPFGETLQAGDWDAALANVQQQLAGDPNLSKAILGLGIRTASTLTATNSPKKAAAILEETLRALPENTDDATRRVATILGALVPDVRTGEVALPTPGDLSSASWERALRSGREGIFASSADAATVVDALDYVQRLTTERPDHATRGRTVEIASGRPGPVAPPTTFVAQEL